MNDLAEACCHGDSEKFKQLFSQLENHTQLLSKQDKMGKRLIHYAAEGGSKEIVAIILDKGGAKLAAFETYTERDTPLHISLQSGKPSAVEISSLFLEKLKEEEIIPRKNSQGNNLLHYACKLGNLELIQALVDLYPDAVLETNRQGKTPLSFAVWEGNVGAVRILLTHAPNPSIRRFKDFPALFPSYKTLDSELEVPIDVFVLGENQSGKSSVTKSVQANTGIDKFWGVTYNTPNVDIHKIGLIPSDSVFSKGTGRVIFHDLATGPKYLNMQLVRTQDEIERSLFIVVVDCRQDKKDMERRLELWLNVVHKQCSNVSSRESSLAATPQSSPISPPLPNVAILGSFGDYVRAFRHSNDIRLDQVIRSVTKKNSTLMSSFNILEKTALDCRKAQSVPMSKLRATLRHHSRRRRQSIDTLDHQCYILSNILTTKGMEKGAPVISLEDLSHDISQTSTDGALELHNLLPPDVPSLLAICKTLEERKKILLIRSDRFTSDEDIIIVYNLQKLAGLIDTALLELQPPPDQPPDPKAALIESETLQEYLSRELSIRADAIIPILDALKIHGLSVQEEMGMLSFDQPHHFIPSLLPETNPDLESWEDESWCFAWTYRPTPDQLYTHFLPTFTNSLLLVLFDLCANMVYATFDYRMLWQGGISFRQRDEIEVVVIISSSAITINLQRNAEHEIECLYIRNKLLEKVHQLQKVFQPEISVEESVIPHDGARFPVSSPTPAKNRIPLTELRQNISKNSFSIAGSMLSLPQSPSTHLTSGSIDQSQPFFEHCLYLPQLSTIHRHYLMLKEHADTELTNSFLYELRSILSDQYEKIEQYFNLPPIIITPASSVAGLPASAQKFEIPQAPPPQERREQHTRTGSLNFKCNTYGKLVECLDSISIFKTVQFLAESQRAEISGRTSLMTDTTATSSVSIQSAPHSPIPPINTRRLLPYTTRSTDEYSNVYFVDEVQVFTCDSSGGVFHSPEHGVTIKFPSGAIPQSSPPVTFEFGVALNGPFQFPSGVKPVSPFIWLCSDSSNIIFQKSVEVIVPHYISLNESNRDKMVFMKASHTVAGGEDEYVFEECTEKMKFRARSNHGVLLTTHTCFLCVAWKLSASIISTANYCLMKVIPKSPDLNFDVFFCFTFFLETCMETVQRQFSSEQYNIERSLVSMDRSLPLPQLSISFEQELPNGWRATRNGGEDVIPATEVDFLHQDIGQLQLMTNYRMYPPRFAIHISGAEASKNSVFNIKFEGLRRAVSYQVQLKLPLPRINSKKHSVQSMDSPLHTSLHILDQIIVELEQYLDVDMIRLRLRRSGILSVEEMQMLVDLSIKNVSRSVQVEKLVDVIKKKGEPGLTAFIRALEETTDGTGHNTILEILQPYFS